MSTTNKGDKSKLASKLKIDTASDNQIIDELIERIEEHKVEVKVEPVVQPIENKVHPLIRYHYKGRSINQLAGMFMISEAEVKRIINEHENV